MLGFSYLRFILFCYLLFNTTQMTTSFIWNFSITSAIIQGPKHTLIQAFNKTTAKNNGEIDSCVNTA